LPEEAFQARGQALAVKAANLCFVFHLHAHGNNRWLHLLDHVGKADRARDGLRFLRNVLRLRSGQAGQRWLRTVVGRYEKGAKPQAGNGRKQCDAARCETSESRSRMFAANHRVFSIFKSEGASRRARKMGAAALRRTVGRIKTC
jgi:hypothetical protein